MILEAQYTVPYFTNVPEDVITNVWHFECSSAVTPTTSDYNALRSALSQLYTDVFSAANGGSSAPWAQYTAARVKFYDLAQPKPRVPVYMSSAPSATTIAATSGVQPEVALCLSYQATPLPGTEQASRRGRIYFGGIGAGFTLGNSTSFPKPSAAWLAGIKASVAIFNTNINATIWDWIVWSRKLGISAPVANGWIDDAFDTQRRRGQKATSRVLWP